MFLASGVGRSLTKEQRRGLTSIDPAAWYPRPELLEILRAAEEQDPMLVLATGRRWGAAIKEEFAKKGIFDPIEAANVLAQVYRSDHQDIPDEDMHGIEVDGPTAFFLTNATPYPNEMIHSAYETMIAAMEATVDVVREGTDIPNRCRISWNAAE